MKRKIYREKNVPYTFARVSAMKAKLIPKSEYHKLLKMDLSAITRYLQESNYRDAVTKMSVKYHGVELVDQALKLNQEQVFSKLTRISPDEVETLINSYMKRIDIQNLKVVIRGIFSNSKKEEVLSLIEPIGKYDENYFGMLFEQNSVENVLKKTKIVDWRDVSSAFDEFRKTNKLIELENELDKLYYKTALTDAKSLSVGSGKIYGSFLLREIDIVNIKNLLRLKKQRMDPGKIMQHMIIQGETLNKAKLMHMASADSFSSLIGMLKGTYYEKFIGFDESTSMVDLQLKADKYIMRNASLKVHQNPLSFMCILSYMMNKVVELKNIRMLVKAKHLGISEDYIEKNLLIY